MAYIHFVDVAKKRDTRQSAYSISEARKVVKEKKGYGGLDDEQRERLAALYKMMVDCWFSQTEIMRVLDCNTNEQRRIIRTLATEYGIRAVHDPKFTKNDIEWFSMMFRWGCSTNDVLFVLRSTKDVVDARLEKFGVSLDELFALYYEKSDTAEFKLFIRQNLMEELCFGNCVKRGSRWLNNENRIEQTKMVYACAPLAQLLS